LFCASTCQVAILVCGILLYNGGVSDYRNIIIIETEEWGLGAITDI